MPEEDQVKPEDPVRAGESSASPLLGELKNWVRDIIFAALTAVLIVVFVIQPVKVEGTSMEPRLFDQERIFVNKFVKTSWFSGIPRIPRSHSSSG
jgi:signal peptidase I